MPLIFGWLHTPVCFPATYWRGATAAPPSHAQPRQSRYTKIGTAILIYSGYYLLYTSARTWVQNGVVPSFPGIWWVPALLGLIVVAALYVPDLRFKYRRTHA